MQAEEEARRKIEHLFAVPANFQRPGSNGNIQPVEAYAEPGLGLPVLPESARPLRRGHVALHREEAHRPAGLRHNRVCVRDELAGIESNLAEEAHRLAGIEAEVQPDPKP